MNQDKIDFDDAGQLFMDAFFRLHPRESLPEWFARYTRCIGKKEPDGTWVFLITAIPATSLRPGQTWELDKKGGYSLISTDSSTGSRAVIISATSAADEMLKLFEARVDCDAKTTSIIFEANIDDMVREELLPIDAPPRSDGFRRRIGIARD